MIKKQIKIKFFMFLMVVVLTSVTMWSPPAKASEPFIGQIIIFAGNFAPRGWALCDGQLLPIAQYSNLFSLFGTIYGGNGRDNFKLPDLRGRVALHSGGIPGPGLSERQLGQKGGTETETIILAQLPSHTHDFQGYSGQGDTTTPVANVPSYDNRGRQYSNLAPDVGMEVKNDDGRYATEDNGRGEPHTNMPPFLAMNYCVALDGLFP